MTNPWKWAQVRPFPAFAIPLPIPLLQYLSISCASPVALCSLLTPSTFAPSSATSPVTPIPISLTSTSRPRTPALWFSGCETAAYSVAWHRERYARTRRGRALWSGKRVQVCDVGCWRCGRGLQGSSDSQVITGFHCAIFGIERFDSPSCRLVFPLFVWSKYVSQLPSCEL